MYMQGQRWFSEAEPELGLGIIKTSENKTVTVDFPAANDTRTYGYKTAPLKRVRYEEGESIQTEDGLEFIITKVEINNDILFYCTKDQIIPEMLLKSALSFTKPQDKLFAGSYDSNILFTLRYKSYLHQRAYQQFKHKGLLGSRVSLIPHQSYISGSISERINPRVMLADEVGLGKTIEAGLILKSLILKNKVERSLIIVPDSLVYQWFFELQNKFNIQAKTMSMNDELDIEAESLNEGPHYIISLSRLIEDKKLQDDVLATLDWDILIIDEAHQLRWAPDAPSLEYSIAEKLSEMIPSCILLSATPEMLGKEGHFSRLKLLDPNRFNNLESFINESKDYSEYIPTLKKIIADKYTNEDLAKYFSSEEIANFTNHTEIINALIDRHGTGRVYFRNTREHLEKFDLFFPKRKLHEAPIAIDGNLNDKIVFSRKLIELKNLLEKYPNEKVLLLVHSKILVLKIHSQLENLLSVPMAMFHSGQSLMERDRQAAYFADPAGARLLLCTEIGSEGRNFEFAHHLFLFDLPKVPEQLEQRIGRLDRIGQTKDINIHVPYIKNSFEETIFRWYKEVIGSFNLAPKGATPFYKENHEELHKLLESPFDTNKLDSFIKTKSKEYLELCHQLDEGHDLLLDLNSFNKQKAMQIIQAANQYNSEQDLKDYLNHACDAIGISNEDLNEFSYYIKPTENMYLPSYPSLPPDGFSYTMDRKIALIRDDLKFLSWEHPLIQGTMDLFTNSEIGNMTATSHQGKLGNNIFFEFIFKLECIAGFKSDTSRFLPITPIRVLFDASGTDITAKYPKSKIDDLLVNIQSHEDKMKISQIPKDAFNTLLKNAQVIAIKRAQKYIQMAKESLEHYTNQEIFRLKDLMRVNPMIKESDIQVWIDQKQINLEKIEKSDLNIDAIRVII